MKKTKGKINTREVSKYLLPVCSIVVLLLVWTLYSLQNSDVLPTPYRVCEKMLDLIEHPIAQTTITGHILASLKRVFIGLAFAMVIGIPFGMAIGWNRLFRAVFQPVFEIIRPIPPLAWVPLITIWCGIFETSKIILVFIGTFMAIVVNTYAGVTLASKDNIAVARMFGVKGVRLLTDIVFPSAIPSVMAGLKTALTTGWGVVLAAEMISADSGLGFLVTRGSDSNDIELVLVAIILIGLIGALMSAVFTIIERKLSPWRTDIN